jgi:arabinofuranosyltransferase
LALSFVYTVRRGELGGRWFLSILPGLIPIIHIVWRRSYYGEWLPNTYYAKHVAAWPEAGIRYLAAFLLEYGLWIWVVVAVAALVVHYQRSRRKGERSLRRIVTYLKERFTEGGTVPNRWTGTVFAVITVGAHLGYYTFVVGGDHFEWRVYSHVLPLAFLSLVYLVNLLNLSPARALLTILLLIAFSLPIPWTHHSLTRKVTYMRIADELVEPISDDLPAVLYPLTKPFDALQAWLIEHHVCVRRQEHRLFWRRQIQRFPARTLEVPEACGDYPTAYFGTVGVASWVLPTVNIIDGYGLNDYVIARHQPPSVGIRRMAHDRAPPEGYLASFVANVRWTGLRKITYYRRPPESELTAEKIRALEKYWEDKIVHGIERPFPGGADSAISAP